SVTLCGELAGKPISAMALIGLGYRSISMSPASIGPVKAMLTELPLAELETFFDDNLMAPAHGLPMRALLQAFADDRSIPL
ncbi:MAG: peptidase, partial [Mesorhizobium sp.]